MQSIDWPRAISLGALLTLTVLMNAVCSSPPEHEPSTEVEPALTETIASYKDGEPVLEEGKGEFIDREPSATADPTAAPARDPASDMEEEEEITIIITGHADIEVFMEEQPMEQILESQALDPFFGMGLMEENILDSDVVVRATMNNVVSEVFQDAGDNYRITLKFTFTVHEYLKGTGANSIVVYWMDGREYETSAAAIADKPRITSWRDSQWDDREAILFLFDDLSHIEYLGSGLDAKLADANTFLIGVGKQYIPDDNYSLYSEQWRVWLPSVSAPARGSRQAASREYLLDVPAPGGGSGAGSSATPTITLADLKTLIASIDTEINSSSDPVAYTECLQTKYSNERMAAFYESLGRTDTDMFGRPHIELSMASGQPAGTVTNAELGYGVEGFTERTRMWLEGGDAELFTVTEGPEAPYTGTEEVEPGTFTFDFQFRTARPLPAGEYAASREEIWLPSNYQLCEISTPLNWTVTVTAPAGTVHEAFFDPTATGFTSQGGELQPATFTAGGVASTVEALRYENGEVVLKLNPFNALTGLHLLFIELDGSIGMVLAASSATAHKAAGSLTWSVAEAPWESGDQLMIRIALSSP